MPNTAAPLPGVQSLTRRRARIALGLVGSMLIGLLALVMAETASAALPVPKVVVTQSPTPAYVGYPVTLTATISNPAATTTEVVTWEKFNGLLWSSVGTAPVNSSSQATFSVTPTSTTAVKYRARIAASATHAAGTSATYSLTAQLKTPTATLTGPPWVVVNHAASLTGAVHDPDAVGESVSLQKWTGLSWSNVGSAQALGAGSQATFTVTPTAVGTAKYRISIAKSTKHAAGASPEFVLNTLATRPFDCGGGTPPLKSDGTQWQWDPLESTCRHASLSIL